MESFHITLENFSGNESDYLPFPVDKIIPQKQSMKMIDFLTKVERRNVESEAIIKPENIFLDQNGILSEAVYMELIAQTIAASAGFDAICKGDDVGIGFLLGAKKMKILEIARVGDKLTTKVFKDTQFGDFGIIQGTVLRDDKIIAYGELKIWAQNNG